MINKTIAGSILAVYFFSFLLFAQQEIQKKNEFLQIEFEQKLNRASQYVLSRIKGPVKLDGLSDELAWKGIEPLPLVMYMPNFGNKPSERTEILVAYDDDYIYAAGRLYDREPSKIQSASKKRDELKNSSDIFAIYIDSFNDKENSLAFWTMPTGLRTDFSVSNDAKPPNPINLSWNTFWDLATVRSDEGWFVEIRIPFSSLRFQDKDGQVVMGLIVFRWIARKNEMVTFPAVSPEWGSYSFCKPSQAQEVVFNGIHCRKPLYIIPYVLGGFGQSFEFNDAGTAYNLMNNLANELGLDIKYGLASNLTLDLTVNTDFAQVEADDQQINLTRFSLFFPEKRLFFQERSSIFEFNFEMPNRLFYTRRIGLYKEKSVRIYGGARLVGRLGSWDLGFFSIQTAPIEKVSSENFSLLRIRRQVINPYSYVGAIFTSKIGANGTYNTAYGMDGIFRLFGDDYVVFNWAQTFESGKENNPVSLAPARIRVNWERRTIKGLSYDLSYSRSGIAYNPGLGFELRDNFTRFGNRLLYGWIPGEGSSIRRHQVYVDGLLFLRNADKATESAEIGPGWRVTWKKGHDSTISIKLFYEDLAESFSFSENATIPRGHYTFYGLNGKFSTPRGNLLFIETTLDAGSFYDGWRWSVGVSPRWNVCSELELSGTYQFNRVLFPARDQLFTAHIARVRALAMLSTKFSATAFIQYNSAIDLVIANIRLRYNPREGNDLYFVYDEGLNTNRYREVPPLPLTSNRTVMLKYIYTFNF
jgi:hypothetical protein